MDFRRLDFQKVAAITNRNFFASEIVDIIRDTAVRDFAIRCFNETKLVDPREGRHRTNQADVWTFRSFDRTNPAVVRRMDVAHFEAGAIATQSAWSERGQP